MHAYKEMNFCSCGLHLHFVALIFEVAQDVLKMYTNYEALRSKFSIVSKTRTHTHRDANYDTEFASCRPKSKNRETVNWK